MIGMGTVFRVRFSNWEATKFTVSLPDSPRELLVEGIGLVTGDWCVA